MWPGQESNLRLFSYRTTHQRTEPHQPGTKRESGENWIYHSDSGEIFCRSLIRNFGGWQTVGRHILSAGRRNEDDDDKGFRPRTLYPSRVKEEIKTFPNRPKLVCDHYTYPAGKAGNAQGALQGSMKGRWEWIDTVRRNGGLNKGECVGTYRTSTVVMMVCNCTFCFLRDFGDQHSHQRI